MKDKGELWVQGKESYIVKRLMDGVLHAMNIVAEKKVGDIRNERVKFFHNCFTEMIDREMNPIVKGRLTMIRNFLVMLFDDDRAYRYRAYLAAVIFANRMAKEFWIEDDDWYLTKADKKKFGAIKKPRR